MENYRVAIDKKHKDEIERLNLEKIRENERH
jgi:hypothetical protein